MTKIDTAASSLSFFSSEVPVVDLERLSESEIVDQIASACASFGFFQISGHGIDPNLIRDFDEACRNLFALPHAEKYKLKRHEGNARGFFDDELTKQRIDWKQCFDAGIPGSRDWTIDDCDGIVNNACLDGYNQFPPSTVLPQFRTIFIRYFDKCANLAYVIAQYMTKGLAKMLMIHYDDDINDAYYTASTSFLNLLRAKHSSYLRANYYPPCNIQESPPPLGISPHKDAGFLTILRQDDACHSLQVYFQERWHTVVPIPGAFTINTGDMAQVWSNGIFQAPLHRVLTNAEHSRYSAPFFYNPGYESWVTPMTEFRSSSSSPSLDKEAFNDENNAFDPTIGHRATGKSSMSLQQPKYHPVLWGYFRAVRFAGDLTDLGVEIQIEDFETTENNNNNAKSKSSRHRERQAKFAKVCRFLEPFSVERYRTLLTE